MVKPDSPVPAYTITPQLVLEKLEARKRIDDWLSSARVVVGDDVWETWVGTYGDRRPGVAGASENNDADRGKPKAATARSRTVPTVPKVRISKISWLQNALSGAGKGLAGEEIVELARQSPLESGFLGDNAAYAYWVDQTANRGKIKRRGGLYFTRELWDRLAEEGAVSNSRGSEIEVALVEAVRELGPGARAGDIVRHTRTNPEIVRLISPTSQYPYVLLAKMVATGALCRSGRDYFLPGTSLPLSDPAPAEQPHLKLVGEARPKTA